MAIYAKASNVYKLGSHIYVKVDGVWRLATKTYFKTGGAWVEVWPLVPPITAPDPTNPAYNAAISAAYANDRIEITGSWLAPGSGPTVTKYETRLVFRNPTTGAVSPSSWVTRTAGQLSYVFNNGGAGYQNFATAWRVKVEVRAFSASGGGPVASSAEILVPKLPAPPAPTSYALAINSYVPSHTWAHVGGNRLDNFELEMWITGYARGLVEPGKAARSSTAGTWNPETINARYQVNSRIRAVGQGGASAWVTITGYMPGPATFSDLRFEAGQMKVKVNGVADDLNVWTQKNGNAYVPQADHTTSNTDIIAAGSSGWARDGITKYRFAVQAVNNLNGWTGRVQNTNWATKLPNPIYITPNDCNTWWSLPNPGKWRTNPQAEDWFYQGRSISGNSVGTLFYNPTVIASKVTAAGVGYIPGATSISLYTKRAYTGGLAQPVQVQLWAHNESNDGDDSFPTLVDGPHNSTALDRSQGAWVPLPMHWYEYLRTGYLKGFSYHVPLGDSDNQMRPEIGNVSNRYIIFDKPHFGAHLDGQPPGTIRIFHDG